MTRIYDVNLSVAERDHLRNLVSTGVESARKLTRARILLKADERWLDKEISVALDVGQATVERIRKKYIAEGLDAALNRKKSTRRYERKLDGATEAHLITLAYRAPPKEHSRWALRLPADRLVKLEQVDVARGSYETVRRVLKKTTSSRGKTGRG